MLIEPSVSFGSEWGSILPGGSGTWSSESGSALLVMALLLMALVTVMWLLAATRRSPD